MKKTALLLAFALACLGAGADSSVILKVNTSEGQNMEYDIRDIEFIDFDGDIMSIHHADGTDDLNIDQVIDMVFDTFTGIEEIKSADLPGDIHVSVNRGILQASCPDQPLTLRIFDMEGHLVDMVKANSEVTYSLIDLPKGIYIILVNDKPIKYIR